MTREMIGEIYYSLGLKLYVTSFMHHFLAVARYTFVDRYEMSIAVHEFYFMEVSSK